MVRISNQPTVPSVDFLDASILRYSTDPITPTPTSCRDSLFQLSDPQPRYRQTDLRDLDVYLVDARGIHPSSLQTSSDSSLGGLADALGGLATALGGLTATPDDVLFVRGGGRSAFLKTTQGLELFGNMLKQGNICQRKGGGAFWQSDAARYSRARSCSVVIRDGRCDNDDATCDSFPLICIGRCISVMGEVNAAAGRSSFERA